MGFYKYCHLSALMCFLIICKVAAHDIYKNHLKKHESVENINEINWQGMIYLSEDMTIEK